MTTNSRFSVRHALGVATGIALLATSGSLYFQFGLGLFPCQLCWFQRILMYPLVVVLGVAAVDNNEAVYRTVLPLTLLGGAIAAYHSLLQRTDIGGGTCGTLSCGSIQYELLGVFTIPNLALIAFGLLTGILCWVWYETQE